MSEPEPGTSEPARPADFVDDAVVVLVGFAADFSLGDDRPVAPKLETVTSLEQADRLLESGPVGVVAVGPDLLDEADGIAACMHFLETFESRHPYQKPSIVIFGLEDRSTLQALVQEDRLFYAGPKDLAAAQIGILLDAAFDDFRRRQILQLALAPGAKDRRAAVTRTLAVAAETLLQSTDLEAAGEPVTEALEELIGAQQVKLWLYDPSEHILRQVGPSGLEVSAVTGLTAFVARTGEAAQCREIAEDPRHDPEVDGERGALIAVPIRGEGEVLGVLVAGRRDGEGFDVTGGLSGGDSSGGGYSDRDVVTRLAGHLSPLFALYAPRRMEAALSASAQGADAELFRREAIEAQALGFSERGRILRNTAGWTQWTWLVLLTGFAAAVIFVLVGRINDYAAGPALILARAGEGVDIENGASQYRVAALIPGYFAPQLEPGQHLRLILEGYGDVPLDLRVSEIGDEVISPQQARRALGYSDADAASFGSSLEGPVVLVEAELPAGSFDDGRRTLSFTHGMQGRVEIRVGSRPILFHLVPGLDAALRSWRG